MKKIFLTFIIMGLTFTILSCSKERDEPNAIPNAKPIVLKSEYQTKTIANRSFALDLFRVIVAESNGENIFISPYSVNTALNMLWNGAADNTEAEMAAVLGNGTYTRDQINDYSKSLTDALLKVDPTAQLKIANSIWADNTTPFKNSFIQTNKAWYNAEVKNVNFLQQATFDAIDKWCLKETNNKIQNISEGMTTQTRFALINAIYFKAKWKHKFNKSDTDREAFYHSSGGQSQIQMMNLKEQLLYSNDDHDWEMLQIPYGNRAFSMVILVPYDNRPLDEMISSLTADKYYDMLNSMGLYEVTVKLPKFTAEYKYELHRTTLPEMGMIEVFNPSKANLSHMSDVSMFVNMVVHKTYIDIDEEGTEAAAATAISGLEATSLPPRTPINFFVNRPFIYSIIENSTGTILFIGRVNTIS